MQEDKKDRNYAYDDGQKDQDRAFFVFCYRSYSDEKGNDACREYDRHGHIPPMIIKRQYSKYLDEDDRDDD
jgi:hypothetical protein